MNKKTVFLIAFVCLVFPASIVFAQSIPNFLASGGVNTIGQLLLRIARAAGAIVGVIGAIMIIVAGMLFLTSAGNPKRIETARAALTYAIVGIVIGLTAEAIVIVVKNAIGVR